MVDASRATRTAGNPNTRDIHREAARIGSERKPEDIPTQDVSKRGKTIPGNTDANHFVPSSEELARAYEMGTPKRPNIVHDTGFASLPRRAATATDYLYLAKWKAMLEGAEILRPDLTDAVAAYRHFLKGEGKPRRFSYDRYVMNDVSGQVTLRNAILDFQFAAIYAWLTTNQPARLSLTGPAIPCGAPPTNLPYISSHFPYPKTENWQKAIGAHVIWLSGPVDVITNAHDARGPLFKCQMTLHAEDRYNFNPGDEDIATSTKDEENGRFEQTRLAFGFDHFAELSRYLEWRGTDLGVALSAKPNTTRLRPPPNNRQVANRI